MDQGGPYRYLEVHHLVRKCRHLVIEAHPVLSAILSGEDKIALSFLLVRHDNLVTGAYNLIIDIERAP